MKLTDWFTDADVDHHDDLEDAIAAQRMEGVEISLRLHLLILAAFSIPGIALYFSTPGLP